MNTFSERLKSLRNKSGLSQSELATRLSIAKSTLAMYETGKREPGFETAQRIADFFNVTLDYLTGRTDNPTGYPSHLKDLPPMERLGQFIKENEFKDLFFHRSGDYFDDLTSKEVDELIMSLLEVRKERLRMEAEDRRKSEEHERKE
ncbi:helix-turn-helix domain-containing protein [Desmospora activa]|uniref:DNA-binding XRE family transcriptional regulator n=1 Tax=Desmospora activa DSM 45169 TaxID=1121389 RepID=A0A2T4ZCH0_9BACL|nr:helix-turn-helix domain-containing protein [Desmospora activa]PTM59584.1 DNA-binding XRE family transcriptional regulator [Desmospora activa DSM 45169]